MMRRALFSAVAGACTIALMPSGAANASEPSAPFATLPCTVPFIVTMVKGDPKTVVLRAVDLRGPFAGTITAYGTDRTWTGTIERAALVNLRDGGQEASVTVRADGPIQGIAYAPTWAPCTFRAATRGEDYYEDRDSQRPVVGVGNPQPLEAASCAKPFVPPVVQHAVEPEIPENGRVTGIVRVAVALDSHGAVRSARVLDSPSKILNVSAISAAARSEYRGAVFRCEAVPGSYVFAVGYS